MKTILSGGKRNEVTTERLRQVPPDEIPHPRRRDRNVAEGIPLPE